MHHNNILGVNTSNEHMISTQDSQFIVKAKNLVYTFYVILSEILSDYIP